jgi:GAF domain-containing protein/HAMP domain-containing protein
MISYLRRIPLQSRLVALFLVPALLLLLVIPVANAQHRVLSTINEQQAPINAAMLLAERIRFITLVGLILLIILVLFILTILLGRSILMPLDDLRASMTAFRLGQHTLLLEDKSLDEIGDLIRSLNQLIKYLNSSYAGLEERVEQRTRALAQRALYLQAAAELARDTTSISDIDDLLDRAVNLIRDRFDLFFVGVYLLDPTINQAILRSGTGEIGKTLLKRGHRYSVGEIGLVGQVALSGETRVVNDVSTDFVYQRHQLLEKTIAQAVFPLKIGNQIIGALDVHSGMINSFDPGVISVLQIMADQLSVSIQNASLVEDLKVRIQETNMLYQRYAELNWSVTKLRNSEIGYEFDRVRVMYYREQLPVDLIARLRNGKPVIKEIQDQDEGEAKQILYIPLTMYNQLIGVIGIEQPGLNWNWTEDELATLESISNQISLALDNSRLLEETQRRSDQIGLLQAVTSIAASQTNLLKILTSVSERLQRELYVGYCDILWFDPDGISASFVANSSEDTENSESANPISTIPVVQNPLFQHFLEDIRSLALYDLDHNPLASEFEEIITQRKLVAMMVTPLLLRGEVHGAILLSSRDPNRNFRSEELALMDQISLQLSSALEVARSFEQTTIRAEKERQLREATQHIRETLDLTTILRSAAQELRKILDVPEVTVRIARFPGNETDLESKL